MPEPSRAIDRRGTLPNTREGYFITYDPRNDTARNLGIPYKKQGIADVVADESRGLAYIVTCEDQHWMLYDFAAKKFCELGPMLTP